MAKPSKKSLNKKSDNTQQNKFQKPSQKPFKQKSQSDPKPQPVQLEDDVPDFPRGGEKSLSKEEREEVTAEVDAEFEPEQRALKKKRKDRITGSQSNDDELGSLFGDGITGKLPKFANKITLKNISPGMKLWGVISEVNEKDIVVSLPGGLGGIVRSSEALDPLLHDEVKWDGEGIIPSTIFHVGQLVSCVVLQLDDDKKDKGKRKLWLCNARPNSC